MMFIYLELDLLCVFRMFMEAVIESLKDLELPHPNAGEQLASVSPTSVKSSQKDDQDAYSIVKHARQSLEDTTTNSHFSKATAEMVGENHILCFENAMMNCFVIKIESRSSVVQ
ncbi:hypothetical protein OIU84_021946 [Salix udensis]|uniref:Uncharacterized protein n=1 Tax=Salix udensis TaxID=889485 RepID=A0AAD6KW12_9ROSI|nr:hypothetical protein OIU84_021946 [Salix udensis]